MAIERFKLLGLAIAFAVIGLGLRTSVFGANSILGLIVGVLVMLGLLAYTFADWRLMDEVSREANKTAWLWGAAIGFAAWSVAIAALMQALGPGYGLSYFGQSGSLGIFALGGLAAVCVQAACSLVGLAGWWISKR